MSKKPDGRASNGGAGRGQGRKTVVRATFHADDSVIVGQKYPDGGYCHLGSGTITIEGRGHSRTIVVALPDGSEIRITR